MSTTIGAEGLPVTHGRDILIADDPASFAEAVAMLIHDGERRRTIEAAARRLVVQRYDWSGVGQDFEHALARVSAAAGDRRRASATPAAEHLVGSI